MNPSSNICTWPVPFSQQKVLPPWASRFTLSVAGLAILWTTDLSAVFAGTSFTFASRCAPWESGGHHARLLKAKTELLANFQIRPPMLSRCGGVVHQGHLSLLRVSWLISGPFYIHAGPDPTDGNAEAH